MVAPSSARGATRGATLEFRDGALRTRQPWLTKVTPFSHGFLGPKQLRKTTGKTMKCSINVGFPFGK